MAVNPEYRTRLLDLIRREGVRFGEVRLSKGGSSSYYIDCRMVTTHPEGAFLIGEIILDMLGEEKVAVVPGAAFGASGEGFVRCSYATSMPLIEEAMTRMARFVERGGG